LYKIIIIIILNLNNNLLNLTGLINENYYRIYNNEKIFINKL